MVFEFSYFFVTEAESGEDTEAGMAGVVAFGKQEGPFALRIEKLDTEMGTGFGTDVEFWDDVDEGGMRAAEKGERRRVGIV